MVLYRKLHNINVGKVLTAMATVEYRDVAIAALFVAAGYFTLTFYDLFALRTIGRKDVPYRIAALAGFTSYSVGHNVGASVFTGGAVRYRIYSAWGLDAIEVAKICFIAGLTFWLGNVTVLGFGFAYHPRGRVRHRPAAAVAQPRARHRRAGRAGRLRRLGVAHAARHRPAELAGAAAERAADAAADRDRHRRSRLLRAGDVCAGAERAAHRSSSTSR